MNVSHNIATAVLSCLGLATCAESEPGTELLRLRDSAGVQIVESLAPAWSASTAWAIADSAVSLIGGSPDATANDDLDGVFNAFVLGKDMIVIADRAQHIRYFNRSGRFLARAGTSGEGPGEISRLAFLHRLPGDTLLAVDARGTFIFVVDTGRIIRTTQSQGRRVAAHAFSDGTLLAAVRVVPDSAPARVQPGESIIDSLRFEVINRDGAPVAPFGSFPAQIRDAASRLRQIFGPAGMGVARGESYYHVFASSPEVSVYDPSGRLTRVFRLMLAPTPVTGAHRSAYLNDALAKLAAENETMLPEHRQQFESGGVAATLPFFTRMLISLDGDVWLSEYRLEDGFFRQPPGNDTTARKWTVISAAGSWLGDVTMPPGLNPLEIGPDYVLGTMVSDDGEPMVGLFTLRKK